MPVSSHGKKCHEIDLLRYISPALAQALADSAHKSGRYAMLPTTRCYASLICYYAWNLNSN